MILMMRVRPFHACLSILYFSMINCNNAFIGLSDASFIVPLKSKTLADLVIPKRIRNNYSTRNMPVWSAKKTDVDDYSSNDEDCDRTQTSILQDMLSNKDDVNVGNFIDTASFLFSKTLDTIEDAYTHLRRLRAEDSYIDSKMDLYSAADCLDQWNDEKDPRPKLLVIGSGWAAHALLKIVDSLNTGYRVLCVSSKNYFLFTPMLASSSVGTIEFRSIVEPIRDSNPTISFLEGTVVDIDPMNQNASIILATDSDISDDEEKKPQMPSINVSYDVVVYACGVRAGGSGGTQVSGVVPSNCHFLKDVSDALRLRVSVGNLFERASRPGISDYERRRLLHFVVVGGGATGVEYIGELSDFLQDVTSKERKGSYAALAPYASILLIHGGSEILPQFDKALRDKALASLESKGVQVRLSTRVAAVENPNSIRIYRKERDGSRQEEKIHCGIIVWAAGTAPVPLTNLLMTKLPMLSRKLSQYGRIPVDRWLRVVGAPAGTFFALGDASMIVSGEGGNNDSVLPQTAQVAAQQGAFMARLLNRKYCLSGDNSSDSFLSPPFNEKAKLGDFVEFLKLRGAVEAKPFRFLNLGLLAFLGGGEALSQIQFGDFKLNEAGSTGFLLWRSVYIVKQVSTRTRLLVLFDWFKCKLFGRDVTRL